MACLDTAKMRSLSSKNKNVRYLLCVIDVFTKYVWVKPLKDEKGKTVLKVLRTQDREKTFMKI